MGEGVLIGLLHSRLKQLRSLFEKDGIRDLSETLHRVLAEQEGRIQKLSEEHAELEAILREMVEGVMVVDRRGRIRLVNEAMEAMFHLRAHRVIGRPAIELLRHQQMIHLITEVLEHRINIAREITLAMPEEKTYRVQSSVSGAQGENRFGAVFVFHDITELRRLERVRKDFVANVSHELRTPLTSIKGYVEALLEGAWKEPRQCTDFLEILRKQTDRLNHIISDLLSLSQIESGKYEWKLEEIPVGEWTERIMAVLQPMTLRKNQTLTLSVPDGIAPLWGDTEKLTEALTNLLENAVKYTPKGGEIGIEVTSDDRRIEISVRDTGIGIPPKDLPRIFERFYRVDRARSREVGGTGLGLSIVKHIVEAHGGKVTVESRPGKGSTFTLSIPRRRKV
jgi:two-component system phosphate regulon sensor histidine kinase PhoR